MSKSSAEIFVDCLITHSHDCIRRRDEDNLAAKIRKSWKVIKYVSADCSRVMPNKVAAKMQQMWNSLAHSTHTEDTKIIKHATSKNQMKMEVFLWLVTFSLSPSGAALCLSLSVAWNFWTAKWSSAGDQSQQRLSNSHNIRWVAHAVEQHTRKCRLWNWTLRSHKLRDASVCQSFIRLNVNK